MEQKYSRFELYCKEIDNGPFSILSVSAKDEIKNYIRLAMEDGFTRGCSYGKKIAKQTS